jgi:hypothetical protein
MLVTFLSLKLFNFNHCVQFLKQSEACLLKIYIGPEYNNNFLRSSIVIQSHFVILLRSDLDVLLIHLILSSSNLVH